MTWPKTPFLELLVDAAEMDRQKIAEALKGVIGIDKSGRVVPQAGFQPLSAHQKLLAFLLGRKAASLLDITDEEAITPGELSKQSGMPEGTVRPALRSLFDGHRVSQDVDKGYYLSPHQVATAIAQLSANAANGEEGGASAPRRSTKAPRKKNAPQGGSVNAAEDVGGDEEQERLGRKKPVATRFSATDYVRELIKTDFFGKPRTLADVLGHLKDKQGRSIKVTSLSPIFTRLLRDHELDRSKNTDGIYEYRAAKG